MASMQTEMNTLRETVAKVKEPAVQGIARGMYHPSQRNVAARNVRRKVWQIHVTTDLFVVAQTTLHGTAR